MGRFGIAGASTDAQRRGSLVGALCGRRVSRPLVGLGAMAAVWVAGCAEKVPPPVVFVDSPQFSEVEGRTYGVLHGDPQSVVVEKVEGGFQAVRYFRGEDNLWKRGCQGSVIRGEELETLRWVPMQSGKLLMVMSSSANPDLLVQHVELLDVGAECHVRHNERIKLPIPGEVMSPGSVPAGVMVLPEGGLRLVDRPKVLRLEGAEGEVEVLLGVRARVLSGSASEVAIYEQTLGFLKPLAVTLRWESGAVDPPDHAEEAGGPSAETASSTAVNSPSNATSTPPTPSPVSSPTSSPASISVESGEAKVPNTSQSQDHGQEGDAPSGSSAADEPQGASPEVVPPPVVDLPELGDDDEHTSFAVRAGQSGTLVVRASGPIKLLEIVHGCPAEELVPLELHQDGQQYVTGARPTPGTFVVAAGRGHRTEDGSWRDLIALRQDSPQLAIGFAQGPLERCIRQVRAFGWVQGEGEREYAQPHGEG